MDKREFMAKVIRRGQITIPSLVREALDLKKGDLVKVTLEKEGRP